MKKSTLVLVALALILGGVVYYFEFKHPPKAETGEAASKPAFPFHDSDVTGLAIARASQPISLEKRGEDWVVTQPVETRADRAVIEGIVTGLTSAQISATYPAAPDRMQAFGLTTPAVTLDIKTKTGASHRLRLGSKDFSGSSVYALIDDRKEVDLLPESLLESTDKPLEDLRDRSVFEWPVADIASFNLNNKSGEVAASRKDSNWKIEKPRATGADTSEVDSLLGQIASARMTGVESETATGLAKYGLTNPEITFHAKSRKGEERSLLIGKKTGEDYFARDSLRPMIFRIDSGLYKKLGESFSQLRDKSIIQFERDKIAKVEIRNGNGVFACEQGGDNKWTITQPAGQKGKEAQSWKFLDPIENAKAEEIYDAPSAKILAKLAKPAIEVTLTDRSGKTTKLNFSAETGGSVYARSSAGPQVYKLAEQILHDLNLKSTDLVQ